MEGEDGRQGRDTQTYTHFIIIYISSAWLGEGKISKNITHRHTLHHYIYIVSLAGGRKNKQKRDTQTDTHTYTSSLYIYQQLGRGKAK